MGGGGGVKGLRKKGESIYLIKWLLFFLAVLFGMTLGFVVDHFLI